MALGAQPAGLQEVFVRHGLLLAAVGAVLGHLSAGLAHVGKEVGRGFGF